MNRSIVIASAVVVLVAVGIAGYTLRDIQGSSKNIASAPLVKQVKTAKPVISSNIASCAAGDLSATAIYKEEADPGILFTYTNRSSDACILYGFPTQVTVSDAVGPILDVDEQLALEPFALTVVPGQTVRSTLDWNSWCGRAAATPVTVKIDLAEGYLTVPVIEVSGAPLRRTPICNTALQKPVVLSPFSVVAE